VKQHPILLVGAGGHCKALIDVIEQGDLFKIEGLFDLPNSKITELLGYPIVGDDSSLSRYKQKFEHVFPAIGFLNKQVNRANLYFKLKGLGYTIPNIISNRSYISKFCKLGDGNAVLHDATLNAGSRIGSNNILQTKSLLDHDVSIGDHNYISTGTLINGNVCIGDLNLIGSNVTINQGCKIGNKIIIGSGTVVVKDIMEAGTYVGVPAKRIK
jgi:sugar O-acyltransferase (sialic acid O-acetyltransferase NeuD family)